MRSQSAFTLIELVTVIAILGILSATAVPFFNRYRLRAYGSEAQIMMNQIRNAEILHFFETDNFFPPDIGDTILITHIDPPGLPEVGQVRDTLHVNIPVNHNLDFIIQRIPDACLVTISSRQNSFPLFGDGTTSLTLLIPEPGSVTEGSGCDVDQICPCAGPWNNHGEYVSCVNNATQICLNAGEITPAEKDAIVSTAAGSNCGK